MANNRALRVALLLVCSAALSAWLVLVSEIDLRAATGGRSVRTDSATHLLVVDEAQQLRELLAMGELAVANETNVYPDEIFAIDWSTKVPRADVLHLGALQRGCVSLNDSILPWHYGANMSEITFERILTEDAAANGDQGVFEALRQCATVDIFVPEGIRGQGYCEDAAVYAKYLRGRILPGWVFKRKFFDRRRNASVTYHELCPRTPLLMFNHYWDGLRDDAAYPATKPLYLMPNIEMFELDASHYLRADVILCKTVVCTQYLTKWFAQEGNPRMTRVIYTRFSSSDVATNALVTSGVEKAGDGWRERPKNFSQLAFTHTAGTSLWKGTDHILDCWIKRPDLPMLDIYISGDFYGVGYKKAYDYSIRKAPNIKLHLGKIDAVAFGTMIAESVAFLCTSVMEGYGHYINHARAAGGLIVAPTGPPMNELVTPSSGQMVPASLTSWPQQFLGGRSNAVEALHGVPGFVAWFDGKDVCEAVDQLIKNETSNARRAKAQRARQQFFYDTAFFADKMKEIRRTLRPANEMW